MVDLCEPRDLWDHGLPRGAVANPGRRAASVDIATDALTLGEHCLSLDDVVRFRAEAGGSMPAPLVAGATYYAKPLDDARFQVSSTPGGDAIDLTSAGFNVLLVVPVNYVAACQWATQIIMNMVPAHAVPFTDPVPPVLRITAAELAARKIMGVTGSGESVALTKMYDDASKRVERWATGVPIRDPNATEAANLAAAAVSATVPFDDRRGWSRYGGL